MVKIHSSNLIFAFKNPSLLEEALTHSTFALENPSPYPLGNERLEFLGDAVLGLCTSVILMELFPHEDEGVLTKARSSLVNKKSLSLIAREIGLGDVLLLGKGEERTGGREKDSILGDAVEALIGAVFLDRGFEGTLTILRGVLSRPLMGLEKGKTRLDAKSMLQIKAQEIHRQSPVYTLVRESGPAHSKTFLTRVKIKGRVVGEGTGKSKKESQQRAAEMALERILRHRPPRRQ